MTNLERMFRDELSQTAIAFKLRLVKPLVCSRVLRKVWEGPFVMQQISSLVANYARFEIEDPAKIFVICAIVTRGGGVTDASRHKVACCVS